MDLCNPPESAAGPGADCQTIPPTRVCTETDYELQTKKCQTIRGHKTAMIVIEAFSLVRE